jgi:predicted RecB family endonuclease
MKKFISVAVLVMSVNSFGATANECFKTQLNNVVKRIDSREFKDNKKALSEGLKACNEIVKAERLVKRKSKLQEQIAKLQAKLNS